MTSYLIFLSFIASIKLKDADIMVLGLVTYVCIWQVTQYKFELACYVYTCICMYGGACGITIAHAMQSD